eukprot:Gb_23326 [translate_table: standard]
MLLCSVVNNERKNTVKIACLECLEQRLLLDPWLCRGVSPCDAMSLSKERGRKKSSMPQGRNAELCKSRENTMTEEAHEEYWKVLVVRDRAVGPICGGRSTPQRKNRTIRSSQAHTGPRNGIFKKNRF